MATQSEINAALGLPPGINPDGSWNAQDYMARKVSGQVDTQAQVDAANAANPYSAQNMLKVDITRPGQYVQDAEGNYVALSANSPGFNINNPTALTYLGELSAKGGTSSAAEQFNAIATPAQKTEAARLWSVEKARLEEIDRQAGVTGDQTTGLLSGQPLQVGVQAQRDEGTTRQAAAQSAPKPLAVPAGFIEGLTAIPNVTDEKIVAAMKLAKVSPKNLADGLGISEGEVAARVAATVPYGQSVILGDTIVAPEYRVTGSGETLEVGALESFFTSKTTGDVNYKAPAGSQYQQFNADGTFLRTGVTQKDKSFFGGLKDAFSDPVVLAALLGGAAASGVFSGLGAGTATGTGLLTGGTGTSLGTGLTVGAGGLGLSTTGAGLGTLGTGAGLTAGAGLTGTGILTGSGLGTALLGTGAGALTGTGILSGSTLGTTLLGTGAGTGVTGALTTGVGAGTLGAGALTTGVGAGLGAAATGLGANNIANLLSGGLGTAGSLLQMQQSKEAAQAAQARIDAETAAAKTAAQFRPIGMTTRFGTSEFQVDPVTGQLISAGYTASPGVLEAQNRLVALGNQGLAQAEAAQAQFAPLQTGAQNLFSLGNQYIAQSPQDVAQNYLNQQMALLQPGRETELANLQNRLQQQGRGGLAVAQGGTLGDTTPELQALYNARVQQEAQLAANAQQYGQQNVAFGAGLLGTGAQTMGNYYGGQQAAYAPYTTALGQFTNLETLAQKPFDMSAALAQQASTAGARVGTLGLEGANISQRLATGANATTNPYAQTLIAAGNPNAMFGQALGNVFGGLFS
jgi:hypothetical protein